MKESLKYIVICSEHADYKEILSSVDDMNSGYYGSIAYRISVWINTVIDDERDLDSNIIY